MIKLSRTWHIPDAELPDSIDRVYVDSHVPLVRRVPGLRRHVVLKAIQLPATVKGAPRHPDCGAVMTSGSTTLTS